MPIVTVFIRMPCCSKSSCLSDYFSFALALAQAGHFSPNLPSLNSREQYDNQKNRNRRKILKCLADNPLRECHVQKIVNFYDFFQPFTSRNFNEKTTDRLRISQPGLRSSQFQMQSKDNCVKRPVNHFRPGTPAATFNLKPLRRIKPVASSWL
jgi:hypothetical protein